MGAQPLDSGRFSPLCGCLWECPCLPSLCFSLSSSGFSFYKNVHCSFTVRRKWGREKKKEITEQPKAVTLPPCCREYLPGRIPQGCGCTVLARRKAKPLSGLPGIRRAHRTPPGGPPRRLAQGLQAWRPRSVLRHQRILSVKGS